MRSFALSSRLRKVSGLLPLAGVCLLASHAVSATDDLFEKRIRPLLVEKCYGCHSPDKKIKGGLRLDHKDGWAKGGDSGPAIIPGKPDESLLIKAVSYKDRDLKMPPKQKLSDQEITALQEWITQGAPDPRILKEVVGASAPSKADPATWWSFQPIRKPQPPAVKDTAWPRNAVDRFILAKLEASNLHPSPDAPAPILARRLSYDLTGLPEKSEVSTSEADTRNSEPRTLNATDSLVNQLLASPAFGERFASHWLDITRFAESSGGGRTLPFKDAWRFRDYVIESFNTDAPLNRFLMEQVAGDLMPAPTAADRRRNLTATAFLVLGPTNYEEQDKAQLRMDIVDEQLDTFGKAFLGLTIGCARCHDHKFDPIPTRDYYALAGILRSTRVLRNFTDNVAHWIDTPLPMDEPMESTLKQKETKLAALRTELDETKLALKKAGVDSTLKNLKAGGLPVSSLPGIVVDDKDAKLIGEWKHSTVYKTFIGEGYISDHNREKGGLTATFQPKMIEAGRYEVRFAYNAGPDRDSKVPVTVFHADGENTIKVDESAPPPLDGRFISLGTFRFEANGEGYVLVSNADTKDYVTADAVQFLKVDDHATAQVAAAPLTADKPAKKKRRQKESTGPGSDGASGLSNRATVIEKEIKSLDSEGPKRPEVMAVRDEDTVENCPIHIRGQIRNLGAAVPRGFLSAVHVPMEETMPADQSGRLQLAHWLVSDKNPLTARVMANRIWLWLMGEGLVRSPDNFGLMGEKPTHPELLDYLASELIDSGWNFKHLVKLIVSSRTYQMTSADSANSKTDIINPKSIDPDNRLYWHQNRKRLDAEEMRDTLLMLGGNLQPGLGGPNIINAKAVNANDNAAGSLEYGYQFTDFRRSLYTPAFRNVRHPLFEVFDFADINQTNGKRTNSTVAPQALFLLNHPFVITECRLAATKLLADRDTKDEARITRLFQSAMGRPPLKGEMDRALHYLDASVSGNATPDELRDVWARLLQALVVSPDFRFVE
jgi:hypothetical protein